MKRTFTKSVVASAIILSVILFSGCQKDLYDPNTATDKDAPITGVPDGFDFSTVSSVNLTVNVDGQYNNFYYTIEVYDKNPIINSDAKLLTKGVGKQGAPFVSVVTVPQTLKSLSIRQTNPAGISVVRSIDVDSKSLTCSFGSTVAATTKASPLYISTKASTLTVTDADFASSVPVGATEFNQNPTNGSSYYIKGGFSGGIELGGKDNITLYAQAGDHINLTSLYLPSNCKLYLLPGAYVSTSGSSIGQTNTLISINTGATFYRGGDYYIDNTARILNKGTLKVNNLTLSGSAILYNAGTLDLGTSKLIINNQNCYFENHGSVEANDINISNGSLTNNGIINLKQDFTVSSSSGLVDNNGTIEANNLILSGNFQFNNYKDVIIDTQATITNQSIWKNEGTFTTKNFTINANTSFLNSCKLIVTGLLNLQGSTIKVDAGAYVGCENLSIQGSRVEMGNKALMMVNQAILNGNKKDENKGFWGTGNDYALLKIKKAVQGSNGAYDIIYYGGNIQVACSDHPSEDVDQWNIGRRFGKASSITWVNYDKATVDIPSSACTAGNDPITGNPPINPTFPIDVTDGTTYTYAMEDLWPVYGDYDINDLVVSTNFGYTLSSPNVLSKMVITANLRAIGANKSLAAAFQLDNIDAASVADVSYSVKSTDGSVFEVSSAKTESGQTKAVIPLFDNAHKFLGASASSITNTVKGGNYVEPKTVVITITFVDGKIKPEDIAVKDLNFFTVTDGKKTDRTEIHLGKYVPTDKADTKLFGQDDDNSSVGIGNKYLSKDNLVWGMMIPVEFKYPIEGNSILKVYSKFDIWAKSGGKSEQNWYETVNESLTYSK